MSRDDRYQDEKFVNWAQDVKERDDFTCQICDRRGGPLHAHHLNSWDRFVSERYDLVNGITLCSKCHKNFHTLYSFGNNTKEQFAEYRKFLKLLEKVAAQNKAAKLKA